jgi:hypothetical protein
MGACEGVGEGLAGGGVGDGLAVVGDGDGLAVVGDGVGDGLTGGGLGDLHGPGDASVLLCAADAPGLASLERPRLGELEFFSVAPPPYGLPFPGTWPECEPLVPLALSRPRNSPWRICPRAKTPATTSTTAPATARVGRSQAMAWPADLRCLAEAHAVMPPRTGRSDLRRLLCSWVSGVAHARSGASGPAAGSAAGEPDLPDLTVLKPDLTVLKKDSHRTTTSQRSAIHSLRSSHHCRLSHGSLSRPRIFVKPSPTGSN